MTLWIVLTALCTAVAVVMTIPLIRRYEARSDAVPGSRIFADQLKELDRDVASGTISEADASLARVEIERRLLTAAKAVPLARPISPVWRAVAIAATASFVVLGATNLYVILGQPELPGVRNETPSPMAAAETATPDSNVDTPDIAQNGSATATTKPGGDVDTLINSLADRLQKAPSDAEGWRMLGWSYFNRQRFDDAATAYAKAVQLDPENLDYKSAYAESLVQAAQGTVVPIAQQAFTEVLAKDPKDFRSRFYMALAREQAGELEPALDQWLGLLHDAPKDAGWLSDVRQRISELGTRTGRDVSGELVQIPAAPAADTAGLAAADQQAAIEGMIAKLAAKLRSNPRDRDGWAMLIRSLKVKGDRAGASQAASDALAAFKDDPQTRGQIAGFAQSLGVIPASMSAVTDSANSIPANTSAPVISDQDKATITALPQADQQSMIQGMVDKLDARLKGSPHDADGWIRLIRSRMVLNQPELARAALKSALLEFSGDASTSATIADAARGLGVTAD